MSALDWVLLAGGTFGPATTAVIARGVWRRRRDRLKPDYDRIRQLEVELGIRPPRIVNQFGQEFYLLKSGRPIRVEHYDEYIAEHPDDPELVHFDDRRYRQAMLKKWGGDPYPADFDAIRDYPAGGDR